MCNALIGFHVLTGCDSNSAVAGLGKKMVSKCYMRAKSIRIALDSLEKKLSSVTTPDNALQSAAHDERTTGSSGADCLPLQEVIMSPNRLCLLKQVYVMHRSVCMSGWRKLPESKQRSSIH